MAVHRDITAENCAEHDHPGNVYNPIHRLTWCRCGEVRYRGDHTLCPFCGDLMNSTNYFNHDWCRQQNPAEPPLF